MLRERFCSHRNALKKQDQSNALVKHIDEYHGWHNYPDDRFSDLFNFTPIQKVPVQASFEKIKEFRLNHEQFWIDTLNTVEPLA